MSSVIQSKKEKIMIRLLAIFAALIALIGCDEGQQMMKPVIQPIIEETPTIEEEPNIEIPTTEEPMEVDLLTVDAEEDAPEIEFDFEVPVEVFDEDMLPEDALIFDSAAEAIRDPQVAEFFKASAEWLTEACETEVFETSSLALELYFTNSDAKREFINALPEAGFWEIGERGTTVLEDAGYYDVIISPSNSGCE